MAVLLVLATLTELVDALAYRIVMLMATAMVRAHPPEPVAQML